MYKNQLQELAQRSCFNLPSYVCIREGPDHAPRFKATVNFNGESFESPTFCSTLRQAEHAAAKVALNMLSKKGPSKALAARVLDETGVYKNLLQETAHKAGLKNPVYTTVRYGPSHVPVFSCTVELAGISFTGEQAKTKKQAQKNAAMTAWSALKELSKPGSSSSSYSSHPLRVFEGNDEQDQVTVARYLSILRPPVIKKLARRDRQSGPGSAAFQGDIVQYGGDSNGSIRSLHSLECQKWAYSHFFREVPLYPTWLQQRASQQQNHLLALASLPHPHIFPFIQSIFQPNYQRHCLAQEQEPVSLVPGISQFLRLASHPMPIQVSNVSQVSMRQIEENPPVEKKRLHSDGDSDEFSTNASGLSPVKVPNSLASLKDHSEQRMQEMLQGNEKVNFCMRQHYLLSPRLTDERFRPGVISTAEVKENPHSLIHLMPSNRPQNIPVDGFVPCTTAVPVTGTTSGFISTCGLRPKSSSPFMHSLTTRNTNSGNFIAPPVHIRTVLPVYSAPPAKKTLVKSQEELLTFSEGEKKGTKEPRGDIAATSLKFHKLQI
ncbi:hypothetical protein P3X46_027783 [Hevea brasiliensis]|uniref:DRBM domain-containing protein n=1 Tax=Hevea brasiliensis TaxID=3981 RepID=A0ABQ9L124_HEVBR|nr:double-stranded RNA-binding protein 2 [Hevea brasiliensis]KAJ9154452.1 hypothetical protein P3X46_027783 [Hevea brasiliensis]